MREHMNCSTARQKAEMKKNRQRKTEICVISLSLRSIRSNVRQDEMFLQSLKAKTDATAVGSK